jgi:hypothetical protein
MNFMALPDSRGGRSITLTLVMLSWAATTAVFLHSWFASAATPVSATEYGMAVTAILAVWLGREWRADRPEKRDAEQS